jgi:hypothetical protein
VPPSPRRLTPETGPYLQIACFCEKVITESDGVLSLVRIVDSIVQTATGVGVPDEMPPFVVSNLTLVMSLKPGKARGRYSIKIRPEDPSGAQLPEHEVSIQLASGNRGVNIITAFQFAVQYEGIYWFDLLFVPGGDADDWLLTRIPLEVQYRPEKVAAPPDG